MIAQTTNSLSITTFEQELVTIIASAMPQIERKPKWISGIRELPAALQLNEIFLWKIAERLEPSRLLNDSQQSLAIEVAILFVVVKNPRNNGTKTALLEILKQQLRDALKGWCPQNRKTVRFLNSFLDGGYPLAARDGKELWLEKIRCNAIQT